MLGFLAKLFTPKKKKDIAELEPIVNQILKAGELLRNLSDDQLRAKTAEFKQKIQTHLSPINQKIESLQQEIAAASENGDIATQEKLFEKLDALKKERNSAVEVVLNQILPDAFAVVKETARRFAQNKELRVQATEWD
ncbi:MAG: preprotein translocase subunit SecA, partial [Bacteroidia bacterium]|nr:preprotein translocase subunit SecA [Bacteroidia bacterium]